MKTFILIGLIMFSGAVLGQVPDSVQKQKKAVIKKETVKRHHWQDRKYNQNIRIARPFGISATLGGGCMLGISLDYFAIPQLSLEAGAGFTQYVAVKYHFVGGNSDIRWSPFIGAAFCFPTIVGSDFEGIGFFSFPLGVHYIAEKGFSFSIAVAVSIYSDNFGNGPVWPWGGIRLGYHF